MFYNFSDGRNDRLVQQDSSSDYSNSGEPIKRIGPNPARSSNYDNQVPQNMPNKPYVMNTSVVQVEAANQPPAMYDSPRYYPGAMNTGSNAMNPPRYTDHVSTGSNLNVYSYSPAIGSLGTIDRNSNGGGSGNVSVVPVDYQRYS